MSARGTWYPGRGVQFAAYDVTWRYPASLGLVSSGRVLEDRTEGDVHIARRVPEGPIRILGFNLGEYERKDDTRNGITVEVVANRQLEDALRPRPAQSDVPSLDARALRRRGPVVPDSAPEPPPMIPHPADQLEHIASQVEDSMAWYRTKFGDPPVKTLTVSPVPSNFGQGFGGMVYLPTVNYVMADSTAANKDQGFFRDLLLAHEVAHQWWGNVVTSGSYHHEWLMEALANYSGLMYMESRLGPM